MTIEHQALVLYTQKAMGLKFILAHLTEKAALLTSSAQRW